MTNVGLIDVDGHHFPNLALMRISSWHKKQGDSVEWWIGDLWHYNLVYKSKVFSDAYTKDVPDPINADKVLKGGTGYCISLKNGKEFFDPRKNNPLPQEIEKMRPDYSIYPQYDFALSMTTRGCPRGCPFCHVAPKEGRKSVKVANVSDFYDGQSVIKVLDANILACCEREDLLDQYIDTGAIIDFTQGLDIRLISGKVMDRLNKVRLSNSVEFHFAWDNPNDDLEAKFKFFSDSFRKKSHIGMVYVLTNYNSTIEQDLHRVYTLRDLGFDPYVMVYNKPSAPLQIKHLQRWCNNKIIFKKCKDFKDYQP